MLSSYLAVQIPRQILNVTLRKSVKIQSCNGPQGIEKRKFLNPAAMKNAIEYK